jgi:hypothetical protein
MMRSKSVEASILTVLIATAIHAAGCRSENDAENQGGDAPVPKQEQLRAVLSFPESLHAEDHTVNEFVTYAMTTCANGDYDSFRLIWSVREEPLTRQEYEKGWKAVRRVAIRALEKARIAPDPKRGETQPRTVYAVAADVLFDPQQTAPQQEAKRHVVLVLTREHDEWRLGQAPRALRTWMADKTKPSNAESNADSGG